jgi:hypothetical protein
MWPLCFFPNTCPAPRISKSLLATRNPEPISEEAIIVSRRACAGGVIILNSGIVK